jgi:hypothetical protein
MRVNAVQWLVFAASVVASVAGSRAPAAPLWGGATAQWQVEVNMTAPADSLARPHWRFAYFYDAELGAELYRHGPGNGDEVCIPAPAGAPCEVLDGRENRTYVSWGEDSQCSCCIFEMAIGIIRRDWLARSGAKREGRRRIRGVDTDVWSAQGQYKNYYAATRDPSQRPVRFWEYKGALLKQWDFDLDTFRAGAPAAGTLDPRPCCRDAPACPTLPPASAPAAAAAAAAAAQVVVA